MAKDEQKKYKKYIINGECKKYSYIIKNLIWYNIM